MKHIIEGVVSVWCSSFQIILRWDG